MRFTGRKSLIVSKPIEISLRAGRYSGNRLPEFVEISKPTVAHSGRPSAAAEELKKAENRHMGAGHDQSGTEYLLKQADECGDPGALF